LLHEFLVELSDGFEKFLPIFLRFFYHVIWNRNYLICHAEVLFIPDDTTVVDKVNNTAEVIFLADGKLQRYCVAAQAFLYLLANTEEVGTSTVHLVDEPDARNFIVVCK